MTASRKDLIEHYALTQGCSKSAAKEAVNAVLYGIEQLSFERGSLTIREFGKFYSKRRAARLVSNPMSGAEGVLVPERTALSFSCSKSLFR